MDDEGLNLEAELKRLQPATPSRALLERIDRELACVPAPGRLAAIRWLWLAALPVAAAVAVVVLHFAPRSANGRAAAPSAAQTVRSAGASSTPRDVPLKPVAAENVLVSARDEGLVMLADGTQARRERLHYVDTITWRNPRTNASLTWSVPREEVRVVPISFQ